MLKRINLLIFIFAALLTFATRGATLDDIRNLVLNGDFKKALEEIEPLRKKSPRDAGVAYWYAQAELGLGNLKTGVNALESAAEKGYIDAFPELIDLYLDDYNITKAQSALDSWRAALSKAKKAAPDEMSAAEKRLLLMSNQMNRVEDFPIIARYDIARKSFDNAMERYNGNRVQGTTFINQKIPLSINNSSREIFWTTTDADGVNRLYSAGILDDGILEDAVDLTKYVGDGDIMSPFMMEDGETLYFASNSEDGLGGYDIYMTRRDGNGGFMAPSNIGMPFNSPGDDLLFVIDEPNNIGWWVTDRFGSPDSVSVMVFVPSTSRVNVDTSSPQIVSRAKADDISLTLPKDFDLKSALKRIPTPETTKAASSPNNAFTLSLGDGRIITSTSQFRSSAAADAMSEVLRTRRIFNDIVERLESMRRSYAQGDKSLKDDIRSLENESAEMQNELKKLTNQVIRLETGAR